MSVFVVGSGLGSSADNMELAFGADAEPGVAAVMKRLRDGIEPDHLLIETGTFFEVYDVDGDMVKLRHKLFLLGIGVAEAGKQDCYDQRESFHSNKSIQNMKTKKGNGGNACCP